MKFSILTLFPEMFRDFTGTSIVGRSIATGTAEVETVQIRDFANDNYKHVDDTPFGGGAGMVMKCQPVLDALNSVRTPSSHVVMLAAFGKPYDQSIAHRFAGMDHLILLCGHYEGMDARIEASVDEVISIGDYVLTGGELGAMVICDSVIRLLDGVIRAESTDEESFENGLLEYPQYTKPAEYEGMKVPDVLLSGNHERIRQWRLVQSLVRTREIRPDLFERHELSEEERKLLRKYDEEHS
ncbi:MAG: tRNA (guanosine(37)-N1)-methyltransferase TrmD [Solobacterium sp.]|nr:tRNA (guanosine(37)-N1)-methyltransferase TrmD [Solobacterium sp.]MBR0478449.1 tRNA (guanosine(37)-N1)-methyltransferase TrmD [Solobacterium sp.]